MSNRSVYCQNKISNLINKLVLTSSTFVSVTSKDVGGAVYFGDIGQCIQSKIFSLYCRSTTWGSHSYITVTAAADTPNNVVDSSFADNAQESAGTATFHLTAGNIKVNNVNISNYLHYERIYRTVTATSVSYLTYNNIIGNTVTTNFGITHVGPGAAFDLKYYNLKNNSVKDGGIIFASCQVILSFSNFINNTESLNHLFCNWYESPCILSHCYLDSKNPSDNSGSVSTDITYENSIDIPLIAVHNLCENKEKTAREVCSYFMFRLGIITVAVFILLE